MTRMTLAILTTMLLLGPPASAAVVDAIVAAIEFDAIPLTTLQAYQQAYAPTLAPVDALYALINDSLLAREARRYGQTLPEAQRSLLSARMAPPGTLSQEEWARMVADHDLAEWFVQFRFGEFVPVSREEMRAYYDAHRETLKQPFEEVEEIIRTRLVPQVKARRIQAYKQELWQRYDVRLNEWLLPKS